MEVIDMINNKENPNRHLGDLGNIEANESGIALIDRTDRMVPLRGPQSVIGRSITVHQNFDDFGLGGNDMSVITGNAGPAIGCGVIGRVESE